MTDPQDPYGQGVGGTPPQPPPPYPPAAPSYGAAPQPPPAYPPPGYGAPPPQPPASYPPPAYGAPPPQPGYQPYPAAYPPQQWGAPGTPYQVIQAKQTNPFAIASLICSIVGIIPFLGFVGVILGITFGFVARSQIRRTGGVQEGSGLAMAGIVIGFVITALWILLIVLGAVAAHNAPTYPN